jgi:hypothetical protein
VPFFLPLTENPRMHTQLHIHIHIHIHIHTLSHRTHTSYMLALPRLGESDPSLLPSSTISRVLAPHFRIAIPDRIAPSPPNPPAPPPFVSEGRSPPKASQQISSVSCSGHLLQRSCFPPHPCLAFHPFRPRKSLRFLEISRSSI